MNRHAPVIVAIATVIGLAVVCGIGGTAIYYLGGFHAPAVDPNAQLAVSCGVGGALRKPGVLPTIPPLDDDQVYNATIVIAVGQQRDIPRRGWVIAIATALQESRLRNLPNLGVRNDHDSIGLFQQRPSQGWGTPAQLNDPGYAADKFYQKLVTVVGWQTMPLTEAAQAVQRSAFPKAYAKHEVLATQIVNTVMNSNAQGAAAFVDLPCAPPAGTDTLSAGVAARSPLPEAGVPGVTR